VREATAGTARPLENTRTRLAVELSSSVAFVAFVSPGHAGRTAANTYDLASGPPVAGDDPVNESDPTGDDAITCAWIPDPNARWSFDTSRLPYSFAGSAVNADYGWRSRIDPGINIQIGAVNLAFRLSLSGRRVRISQSISVWSGPAINPELQWQCWMVIGGLCPPSPQKQPPTGLYLYPGYTTGEVSWPTPPSSTGPYLVGNGPFTVHLNWNFVAAIPAGQIGSGTGYVWKVKPLISPEIRCNSQRLQTCLFS